MSSQSIPIGILYTFWVPRVSLVSLVSLMSLMSPAFASRPSFSTRTGERCAPNQLSDYCRCESASSNGFASIKMARTTTRMARERREPCALGFCLAT